MDELKETITKLITAVLGPVEIRFREADYGFVSQGIDVDVKKNDKWVEVAGCGMLKVEMIREAGHNPERVQGYAFGLGIERLAMLKLGLKSILDLWRTPYVRPLP